MLSVAAVAHAANKPADALTRARAAMASASFEKALTLADRALKGTADATLRSDLELVRAQCFHALRKKAQMAVALDRALRANPLAALDADLANPELINELERRRKTLSGMLAVSGKFEHPPRVALDGRSLGTAPLSTAAAVGRHRVTVNWPGGEIEEHDVTIHVDAAVSLALTAPAPEPAPAPAASPPAPVPAPPAPAPEPLAVATPEAAPAPAAEVAPDAPVATVETAPSGGSVRWQWLSLGAGAVAAIVGGVCLGVAGARYNALVSGTGLTLDRDGALAYAAGGRALQATGIALAVAAVVAAAAGALGLALDPGEAHVALGVAPGGGAFVGVGRALP
jgi:hypothetical protein